MYLYGVEFDLFSDHQALERIFGPKSKQPPRIERWALRIMPYRFKVIYIPGKSNPSDVFSRAPVETVVA